MTLAVTLQPAQAAFFFGAQLDVPSHHGIMGRSWPFYRGPHRVCGKHHLYFPGVVIISNHSRKNIYLIFLTLFLGSIKPLVWDEVSCKPTFQVSRAIFDQNQVFFWSGMLRTHQRPTPGLAATSLDCLNTGVVTDAGVGYAAMCHAWVN